MVYVWEYALIPELANPFMYMNKWHSYINSLEI